MTNRTITFEVRDTENQPIQPITFELPTPCTYKQGYEIIVDTLKELTDESRESIKTLAETLLDAIINPLDFQNGHFCWLKSPEGSELPFRIAYLYYAPTTLAKAKQDVEKAGGLKEAKKAVANNVCNASYYLQGGSYFRYNAYGVDIVSNGKYERYNGHLDSNRLVHLDYLQASINLVEKHNIGE